MSTKKGSPDLMANIDEGGKGISLSGNFYDILWERSLNKWMIPKKTGNMTENWRLIGARTAGYNNQFLIMRNSKLNYYFLFIPRL